MPAIRCAVCIHNGQPVKCLIGVKWLLIELHLLACGKKNLIGYLIRLICLADSVGDRSLHSFDSTVAVLLYTWSQFPCLLQITFDLAARIVCNWWLWRSSIGCYDCVLLKRCQKLATIFWLLWLASVRTRSWFWRTDFMPPSPLSWT